MAIKLEEVVPSVVRWTNTKTCLLSPLATSRKQLLAWAMAQQALTPRCSPLGKSIISVDPLYAFRAKDIETQFKEQPNRSLQPTAAEHGTGLLIPIPRG